MTYSERFSLFKDPETKKKMTIERLGQLMYVCHTTAWRWINHNNIPKKRDRKLFESLEKQYTKKKP